ncbi:hypothetical protein [Brevibacterium sp. 2SA]|uniref:hypothetical protein n=1 Tax=Brevibacterium sp. 2SA TaxID=2502198 RepID=UPI0010F43CB5|nr:hypothetical protein [Brevibacterium sp. 2SA]
MAADDSSQSDQSSGQPRRTIRFFPDYGRTVLWENGSANYALYPEDLGLSDSLSKDIRDWNSYWNSHFDPFDGWKSEESHQRSQAEGDAIVDRLRAEICSFADVVDDRWV